MESEHHEPGTRTRRTVLGLLGTGLAAAAVSLPAAKAAHAAPPTPDFGPEIDGYAYYDGQDTCDPTAKPGTVDFMNLVLPAYPGTSNFGISRECSASGTSEHKEGRAWDWAVRVEDQAHFANDLLGWLMATDRHGNPHALIRRFGIMYVIWNNQIWKSYEVELGWQAYGGPNPHTDHLHFSFSWAGANRETTWWTRRPPPTQPPRPAGPRPGGPSGFAAVYAVDRLDVFGRAAPDSSAWHNFFDRPSEATFPGWDQLRGASGLLSVPRVTSWANGRLDVFALDGQRRLQHWYFDRLEAARWLGPDQRGTTTFAGAPTVVSFDPGRLDVFGRGTNGALRHNQFERGRFDWPGWEHIGAGGLGGDPVAVAWSSGRWDVFVVGNNGRMRHYYFDRLGDSQWHGHEIGTASNFAGTPAAVSWTYGRLDVFARDTSGNLMHTWYDRGGASEWGAWERLAGGVGSDPVAVTQYNGRLDVFYVSNADNTIHQLYFDRLNGNTWRGPGVLGGAQFTGTIDAKSWRPGRLDVFGVDTAGRMQHAYFQHGVTTAFSAWEHLPGRTFQ